MDNCRFENRIYRKLRSEAGASITYALLLFLVCAALSAVILVAATTTSGRMSGLAKTDQNYYAVTSAAGLIRDLVSDQSVSVFTINGSEEPAIFDKPMNQITNKDIKANLPGVSQNMPDDTAADEGTASQTGSSGAPSNVKINDFAKDLAKRCADAENSFPAEFILGTPGKEDDEDDPLRVSVKEEYSDGNLMITLDRNGYKMMLLFSADIRDANPPVTLASDYSITNPSEISWHLDKMISGESLAG